MRRRYVYRTNPETGQVESIEVTQDWKPTQSERTPVFTDRYMEGVCATDGTDISSRAKRRAYMEANSLADADDFKNHWAKAKEEREKFFRGEKRDPRLKEALIRAMNQPRRRK